VQPKGREDRPLGEGQELVDEELKEVTGGTFKPLTRCPHCSSIIPGSEDGKPWCERCQRYV